MDPAPSKFWMNVNVTPDGRLVIDASLDLIGLASSIVDDWETVAVYDQEEGDDGEG
jgi:hypothetical protein